MNILDLYRNGEYDACIKAVKQVQETEGSRIELDRLLSNALVKANRVDEAAYHAINMMQVAMQNDTNKEIFSGYYDLVKGNSIIQVAIKVLLEEHKMDKLDFESDFYALSERIEYDVLLKYQDALLSYADTDVNVFPLIWPVAYGDCIVINQFVKEVKRKEPAKPIIVIVPLNRPELKDLFELNDAIDLLIDITLLPEEKDRMRSLGLFNNGMLNVAHQEIIIKRIIELLKYSTVYGTRYFPLLNNVVRIAGRRIWEERARLWLEEGHELPKLIEQKEGKQDKIVVHFREADYSDPARCVNVNYAQDLIDTIIKEYPGYEVVRLGDAGMTKLHNCVNASHNNLSIVDQIKEIQQAKLFIGCHSAPQHLAIACSDTPVICINYMVQETSIEVGDNIPFLSYGPIGAQVKKIFYAKLSNEKGEFLLPRQNSPRANVEYQTIEEVMEVIKEIL